MHLRQTRHVGNPHTTGAIGHFAKSRTSVRLECGAERGRVLNSKDRTFGKHPSLLNGKFGLPCHVWVLLCCVPISSGHGHGPSLHDSLSDLYIHSPVSGAQSRILRNAISESIAIRISQLLPGSVSSSRCTSERWRHT